MNFFKKDLCTAILGSTVLFITVFIIGGTLESTLQRQWTRECMTSNGNVNMACSKPELLIFFESIDFPDVYLIYPHNFFALFGISLLEASNIFVTIIGTLSFYILGFYAFIKLFKAFKKLG